MKELIEATKFARKNKLAVFVLGGGSNILVSDEGFDGLVIKMNICGSNFTKTQVDLRIQARAGEMWDDVVARAVELNADGIENLSLIPGTVGGAVYQNIGAYGVELKDVLISVKAYDIKSDEVIELSNRDCDFGYRSSVFKKNKNLVILGTKLLLPKSNKPNLSYPDLQKRFNGLKPTISEVRQAIIEIRLNKIPYPSNIMPQILKNKGHLLVANAGSFFKNPAIPIINYQLLTIKFPDLKGREMTNGLIRLSAAQFIEKSGFKGKRFGNVGVSEKHALVLVNYDNGTAKELIDLAEKIRVTVKTKFGVELEAEVEGLIYRANDRLQR